jgi:hypothetical protein
MHFFHSVIKGLLALLIFPSLLLAQASAGITGVVQDETGAAIAGATLRLLGQDTGATRSTTSRQDGTFIFEDVSPANNGDTVANDRPPGVTRSTGRGPQTLQLDVRFAKTFNVARLQGNKRDSFDITVDVFNAINRVNVTNIVGVLSSPFFGRGNSASPARTVQFGLRYRFRR